MQDSNTHRRNEKTSFRLVLEASSRDSLNRDAATRLRAFLKMALRAFNFKCVEVAEVPSPGAEVQQ